MNKEPKATFVALFLLLKTIYIYMDKLSKIIRESILSELGDGPKFKPTYEWMEDRYLKANKELFGGALGACVLKTEPIKSNTRCLGLFSMSPGRYGYKLYANKITRQLFLEDKYGDREYIDEDTFFDMCHPTITLSAFYSGTEESLYATLVHEMCHYYTYMRGYAPKQGHGPEFRRIGSIVASRSNGLLTVQRIASAEQMDGYDVDNEIKQSRERRAAAKRVNAHYYLIVWEDGRVGLTNPTSACLKSIINWEERSESKVKKILDIIDREITNEIYDVYGFRKRFKTYRCWSDKAGITQNAEIVKKIMNNPNAYKVILEKWAIR